MSTVHVSNIATSSTERELGDFFSFCGKISSITVTPGEASQTATVVFERESASKTALLLDGTQLGSNTIKVQSAASIDNVADDTEHDHDPEKGDVPRTAVLAEYLSRGYVIGDNVLQKGVYSYSSHLRRVY